MKNKKILITGATSGLGKLLCRWLSDIGADLYLFSRSQGKLENLRDHLSYPCTIFSADFCNANDLESVLDNLLEKHALPDIVIHCAGGGLGKRDPLLSRADFECLWDINLAAIVQINHKLIPRMLERKSGVIIHVGSTAAHAAHGSVGYNTAKAALAAYVRSLGRALAATGVVVAGISPGSFLAEDNTMCRFKNDNPVEFNRYVEALPSRRMIEAKELLRVIQMLCEQESTLFSGCMVPVDAGEGMAYVD